MFSVASVGGGSPPGLPVVCTRQQVGTETRRSFPMMLDMEVGGKGAARPGIGTT